MTRAIRTLLGDRVILRRGAWGLDWHRNHPVFGRRGWTVWLHGVPLCTLVPLRTALRHAFRAWRHLRGWP